MCSTASEPVPASLQPAPPSPTSSTESEGAPASPQPAATAPIALQVGERRFTTTHATLATESAFFSSLLSGRWNETQADGSYFIDADGDLFVHILRYLRRGVFPLFYDRSTGHDHALYLALLQEASYFGIARLESWIREKQFLRAVKITYSTRQVEGADAIENVGNAETADTETVFHPERREKKVYVCPRGIAVHDGNPAACGRACEKAKQDGESYYIEEEVLRTLVISKRTIIDREICITER